MKKYVLVWIFCVALFICTVPTVLVADASEIEGDWTTYRFAGQYEDPNAPFDPDADPVVYQPTAGYRYTDEGLTTLRPEYSAFEPRMTVSTKEVQEPKKGIYLQFRVDEFCYDAGRDANEWIALSLFTESRVEPGSAEYGGGWMVLIRGKGDGVATAAIQLTDPATDTFQGRVTDHGTCELTVPRDEQGREIYTLEIAWDGSAYTMKLNGTALPNTEEATALLERLNAYGEYFVGIHMYADVAYGTAGLTILKYGESEATATTPRGDDAKDPDQNCIYPWPTINTEDVPAGQPARWWAPSENQLNTGYNLEFSAVKDSAWQGKALGPSAFLYFPLWTSGIYTGADFPVVTLLVRNLHADTVSVTYDDGFASHSGEEYTFTVSVSDCEALGANREYLLIPVEMTVPTSNMIESLRIGLTFPNPATYEFELCYIGAFRSVDEARFFAVDYLQPTKETDTLETQHPETEAPEIQAPADTNAPADTGATTGATETTGGTTEETGCASVVGFGAVAILAAAAAAVALKKKD